jgi:surface polysaccharide O-acyltransferase-like enzyme
MSERNITLDYFKLLMSILVIAGHLQPLLGINDLSGWLISNGVVRLTMPCFLMINGYFIHSRINSSKFVAGYLKHVFILYVVWMLIYLPQFYDFPVKRLLVALFTGYFHLWYIVGLFVSVALFFLFKKIIKRDTVLLWIVIALYIIGFFVQFWVQDLPHSRAFNLAIYRNGLFYGLPFLFIGYYIRMYEQKLKNIKNLYLYLIAFACMVVVFVESYYSFSIRYIYDMLLIAPVLCPVLFLIILKHSKFAASDGYIGNLASGVYFTHVMVITLVMSVFGERIEDKIFYLPLVFFVSMLMSAMLIELNKRVKWFL